MLCKPRLPATRQLPGCPNTNLLWVMLELLSQAGVVTGPTLEEPAGFVVWEGVGDGVLAAVQAVQHLLQAAVLLHQRHSPCGADACSSHCSAARTRPVWGAQIKGRLQGTAPAPESGEAAQAMIRSSACCRAWARIAQQLMLV